MKTEFRVASYMKIYNPYQLVNQLSLLHFGYTILLFIKREKVISDTGLVKKT